MAGELDVVPQVDQQADASGSSQTVNVEVEDNDTAPKLQRRSTSTASSISYLDHTVRGPPQSRWAQSIIQKSKPAVYNHFTSIQRNAALKGRGSRNIQEAYLAKVQKFSERCPEVIPLVSYLQASIEMPQRRLEDGSSSTIVRGDVYDHNATEMVELNCSSIEDFDALKDILQQYSQEHEHDTRLIIAPDLSPAVISLIGEAFDVNPLVFASALRDVNLGQGIGKVKVRMPAMESFFGSRLFTYECETDVRASFTCTSQQVDFEAWSVGVTSSETVDKIDAAIRTQFNKGEFVSFPLIEPDPFTCVASVDHSTRSVELTRSFRILNRLTGYHVDKVSKPTFLLLGTPQNHQLDEDLVAYEGRTWIDALTQGTPTQIIDYDLQGKGNLILYKLINDKTFSSVWKTAKRSDPSQATADNVTKAGGWTADVVEDIITGMHSEDVTLELLNLRASICALESFEQTTQRATEKMQEFRERQNTSNVKDTNSLISVLRTYRYALMNSKERLITHTSDFERLMNQGLSPFTRTGELRTTQLRVHDHLKELQEVQKKFQALLDRNEQLTQDCLFDLQIQLAQTQLEESRRSIQQNDTIRRLTVLAFVFVPVSTVSSIFGMNVRGLADAEPWAFALSLILVLLAVLLLAQWHSMVALLSALEATAFAHIRWTNHIPVISGRRGLKIGLKALRKAVVSTLSQYLVTSFAITSLLLLPLQLVLYNLRLAIEYGKRQQTIHKERRLNMAEPVARAMMRESIDDWIEQMRDRHWCYRVFWRLMFLPALGFAFILHRLDPLPYEGQGKDKPYD